MDSMGRSTFGWLVLTAANARQAAAYDALLAPRVGRGPWLRAPDRVQGLH